MNNGFEMSKYGEYKYRPLPDPSTYIRLLEVFEADNRQHSKHLRCRLTAWGVDNVPSYHAISYTWGEAAIIEYITVEGEASGSIGVRKNLADVLRRLLYFKTSHYYWIDALCIDQQALDEKGHQVAFMGSIFRNAKHVLACLGDHDSDGSYAMTVLLRKVKAEFCDFQPSEWHVPAHRHHEEITGAPYPLPLMDEMRYAMSLASLSRRPYFSRVWVVQELVLARAISILYGEFRFPFEIFSKETTSAYIAMTTDLQALQDEERPSFGDDAKGPRFDDVEDEYKVLLRSSEYAFNRKCIELLTFLHANRVSSRTLNVLKRLECQDRRDRVYGGLEIIKSHMRIRMKPDYNISAFQLAVQMLEHGLDTNTKVAPGLPKSPPRTQQTAKTLIKTLRITAQDPDLREAITVRQRTVDCTISGSEWHRFVQRSRMLTFHVMGRQLSKRATVWRYDDGAVHIVSPNPWSTPKCLDIWVPPGTLADDWVLLPPLGTALIAPYALVIRQVGERFAIIGQAEHQCYPYPLKNDEDFEVIIDAEDLLVFVALDMLSGLPPIREVRFCREPLSSFAEFKRRRSVWVDEKSQRTSSRTKFKRTNANLR